jgi:signal transduction histidine kinase
MERDEVRHALRTPLTVIKGVLSLLARADDVLDPVTRADLIARSIEQIRILETAIDRIEGTFPGTDESDNVIVLYEEDADGNVVGPSWHPAESATA